MGNPLPPLVHVLYGTAQGLLRVVSFDFLLAPHLREELITTLRSTFAAPDNVLGQVTVIPNTKPGRHDVLMHFQWPVLDKRYIDSLIRVLGQQLGFEPRIESKELSDVASEEDTIFLRRDDRPHPN